MNDQTVVLETTHVGTRCRFTRDAVAAFKAACRDYVATRGPLRASSRYQPPPGIHLDDEKYEGDAYGAYAWAVYVAEVSVDTTTFETRVDDFVAVHGVATMVGDALKGFFRLAVP